MAENKLCIFQNLKKNDIKRSPFTFIVINNCIDEKIYKELDALFPKKDIFDYKKSDNNVCYRIPAAKKNKEKSSLWSDFINYHTSKDFYEKILNIFEEDFKKQKYYENLITQKPGIRFDAFYNTKILRKKINLDCQLVINTPAYSKTEVVEPHLDNNKEIYAGLLYMKDSDDNLTGGNLLIYEYINQSLYGKLRARKEDIKLFQTITYEANKLVFFINSPFSLHGVSPREANPNFRKYVNIIGESEEPLFSLDNFF